MSYNKAMKWGRKHIKGTRQPVIMSTGSGFWPSIAFIENTFIPYIEKCKAENVQPMTSEELYNSQLRKY